MIIYGMIFDYKRDLNIKNSAIHTSNLEQSSPFLVWTLQ